MGVKAIREHFRYDGKFGGIIFNVIFEYDEWGNNTSVSIEHENTTITSSALTATYGYTNDLLTSLTTGSTTYTIAYGDFAQTSSITAGSQLLVSYLYTEDKNRYLKELDYGNGDSVQYEYDDYGRLTKETFEDGDTVTYRYDNTGALATVTDSVTGNKTDTIDSFDVTEARVGRLYRCKITDADGNMVYSEPGEIKVAADVWEFTYNADGLRTSRTNGYTTYEYVYHGSQLSRMTVGSQVLTFGYDASGTPLYVIWNGSKYFYTTNLQGDVVAIVSTNGNPVVYYTYDAWGNILSITGTRADNLGKYNPLRYRGYVYDQETGLYYLQSRYYDPTWGRFLNADSFVSTGQGLLGNNMFAYCRNNPERRIDISGTYDLDCDDTDSFLEEDKAGRWSCGGQTSPNTSNHKSVHNSLTSCNSTHSKLNSGETSDTSTAVSGSQSPNPLSNITYTPKVIQDMSQSDFHGFPNIVDNYGYGRVPVQIVGGDGNVYYRLTIEGSYKGYCGDFVYIWDQNGLCNHRCFEKR